MPERLSGWTEVNKSGRNEKTKADIPALVAKELQEKNLGVASAGMKIRELDLRHGRKFQLQLSNRLPQLFNF